MKVVLVCKSCLTPWTVCSPWFPEPEYRSGYFTSLGSSQPRLNPESPDCRADSLQCSHQGSPCSRKGKNKSARWSWTTCCFLAVTESRTVIKAPCVRVSPTCGQELCRNGNLHKTPQPRISGFQTGDTSHAERVMHPEGRTWKVYALHPPCALCMSSSESEIISRSSVSWLFDPSQFCSPPGSPDHGVLQARIPGNCLLLQNKLQRSKLNNNNKLSICYIICNYIIY